MRSVLGWIAIVACSVGLLAFGNRLPELAGATSGWWVQPSKKIVDNRKPSELLAPGADQTSPGLAQLAGTAR